MSKRRKQSTIETSATAPAPARSPLPWLAGALLMLLVFLAYRPAVGGAYIWDDDDYVAQNPTLRSPGGLLDIWLEPRSSPQYYPMVFTTYWLEYRLWGLDPRGYHETNVLLHAASSLLLWRLLRRLRVPGAYLAAAIFAVHPVMVESVAWITERKNTLSMLFYLASMYAYLRFARVEDLATESAGDDRPRWSWYAAALALFVLALLSKTVTASLPAAILLILWWKGRLDRRHAALLVPFFVLGLIGGLYTSHLEHEHVGASGPEWSYMLAQRVLIAGRAVWFYATKLLVPYKLTFVYPKWPVGASWQWVFPAAAVALVVTLFLLRNRIGRGPLVAVLIFGGTLVPALGFVNVYPMRYTFVADHYQYHASAAFIALLAAILTLGAARLFHRRGNAPVITGAVIVLVLFALTLRQSSIYKDRRTLWTDTVAKSPNSWMAWTNLGLAASAESPPDAELANRAHRKALELAPNVADTRYNMGHLYLLDGNLPAAQAEFERAIEIEPKYVNAYDLLGYTLVARKQVDAGLAAYHKALELDPRNAQTHYNLGIALRDRGEIDNAAEHFAKAAEYDPGAARPLRELANIRIKQRRYADAADALGRLLAGSPGDADAHFDRGVALKLLGQNDEAEAELREAVRLKPELQQRLMGLH